MIVKDDNSVPELLKRIEKINNTAIQVGIFGEDDSEVLLYASVHEFGSINVPERSFIRRTFDSKEDDISGQVEDMLLRYIDGYIDYETCTNAIGEYLVGLIRQTIIEVDSPSLAQSTIDRKGSSNPLVDTGRMGETVTYKVVEI